jgi:hypothetical protein
MFEGKGAVYSFTDAEGLERVVIFEQRPPMKPSRAVLIVIACTILIALGLAAYSVVASAHPARCHVPTSTQPAHERTC